MPGKKSGRTLLREQGFERTDNDMEFSSWPQVNMINQKNYYTEYLKRDEQLLVMRLQNEETRNTMARAARDKDRTLAQSGEVDADADEDMGEDQAAASEMPESVGSNVIVIHPGSQNLRVGFANDALPKTVPMVIAKKASKNESEENEAEPRPKRRKFESDPPRNADKAIDEDFIGQYASMTADLKVRMRMNKRRLMPNSKELVVNFNRKSVPDLVPEHNDHLHIEWTEVTNSSGVAPEHITGHAALRIPDDSKPRYVLHWPLRYGWLNEVDYSSKNELLRDFSIILEEAITRELNIERKKDWSQYGCVFVIPDLYDRNYVTTMLDLLLREFAFGRVCFIQESLSASFGAGHGTSCIVDIGAQKTSICCVDEGMCIENSRVNLKFGGADVTDTFIKMLLVDQFPYAEINLWRRYDFLLAEELKQSYCTLSDAEIVVQSYEFSVRAWKQDTQNFHFKVWDAVICAPLGYFNPLIFDNSQKLHGRHELIGRSYDLYDGSPNDPVSTAQNQVLAESPNDMRKDANETDGTPAVPNTVASVSAAQVLKGVLKGPDRDATPRSSILGSPVPEDRDTPQPDRAQTPPAGNGEINDGGIDPLMELIHSAEVRDSILPIMALDQAIILAIENGAKGDERKTRDYLGGIMLIGGGSRFPNLNQYLEERLRYLKPNFLKEILIGPPPRDMDPQVLVWKGASVFGKLRNSNDTWMTGLEYDRLGTRLLAHKCQWPW